MGKLPGTTSRASKASLYSTKPKPFISLISVISPVPWVAKWASTSALVTRGLRQVLLVTDRRDEYVVQVVEVVEAAGSSRFSSRDGF